jgi:hypothetical protein
MRDIVSVVGTFLTGLTTLPSITTTQTSPNIDLRGYDGCMIYIMAGAMTGSGGTMTPIINVAPDNGSGAPGSFTAAPASDLVLWTATSSTDHTPIRQALGSTLPNGTANTTNQPQVITTASAASQIYQRIGYIGCVAGVSDWLQVVSTASGTVSTFIYDVVVLLGRPRTLPAKV